jgi:hypothetical protein
VAAAPLHNNNNTNDQFFNSAFLNTQRHFTYKKGIHIDSTDTQTKEKNKQHHNNRQHIKRAGEGGRWRRMICQML